MKGLEFLKNASLEANDKVRPVVARTSTAKARNPETADIRVFKDGSVYPSATLVKEFDLTYRREETTPKGNGFDVFKSQDFPNTAAWPKENRVIFIAAVDKSLGKLDLFGRTTYTDDTKDPSDVMSQGAATFGKQLLEMVKEVYGTELDEAGYIDLLIARDTPITTDNGKYYVPKVVSRGAQKGESTIVTRESLTLFPLVPASWADEEKAEEAPADAVEPEASPESEEETAVTRGMSKEASKA